MRHAVAAAALLALLAVPLLGAQDSAKKACDMATIEDGLWCPKCKKVLVKTEKTTDFDKDNNCKECKTAPEKIKVCVKDWIPECNMHDKQPHEKCCCKSKMCCKVEIVYSVVTFKCSGCGAESMGEDKIQHADKEHEKKIVKVCAKSGTFPHGGELPKK